MWLQKFRQSPVTTVAGTLVSAGLTVALLFVSAFFVLGLLAIGIVWMVYRQLFGGQSEMRSEFRFESRVRQDNVDVSHTRSKAPPNVLEGDFKVLDSEDKK